MKVFTLTFGTQGQWWTYGVYQSFDLAVSHANRIVPSHVLPLQWNRQLGTHWRAYNKNLRITVDIQLTTFHEDPPS